MLKRTGVALTSLLTVAGLSACTGGGDDDAAKPWSEAGPAAAGFLDDTSGITASIATGGDPGVDFLSAASGTVVADPPAFEGEINGTVSGFPASGVPVISVDGKLWINHALLGGWSDRFQPDNFCAPDPAKLLDPATGVSQLLTSSTGVGEGKVERGGADNDELVTTYQGNATGDSIRKVLPCAEGTDFGAVYRVDDSGHLTEAELTGVFFKDAAPITYVIKVSAYDVTKDIKAPK